MSNYRLWLDEAAFRALFAGRTVRASVHGVPVDITLACPWPRLVVAFIDGFAEANKHLGTPPDPPEAREFLPPRKRK